MQMPQSDWLSYHALSAIGVPWLRVLYEMEMICMLFSKTKVFFFWQAHYFGKNNLGD